MKQKLTKHAMAWGPKDEENLLPRGEPCQYKVWGSASGEVAWITKFDNSWKVLHIKEGVHQGSWAGDYKSADEAFEELQKEYSG